MGFLSGIFSAAVKTVLIPVAIVKDVANVVTDGEVNVTEGLVDSAVNNVLDAADDLGDGNLL